MAGTDRTGNPSAAAMPRFSNAATAATQFRVRAQMRLARLPHKRLHLIVTQRADLLDRSVHARTHVRNTTIRER
ncbi:hypothetical protein [Fodinicola acaciae]|uniref:hypothetical protein n=1 Tax=Fodinicola acaciae TaxID=2681555 RepID=UPI0013D78963|nr:hypothetical protein [Fodinicola acaciae]